MRTTLLRRVLLSATAVLCTVAAPARAQFVSPVPDSAADRALYERLSALAMASYDSLRGGFVRRDGTPCESAIELALVRGREGDTLAAARARRTLGWMRALLDTVGGGWVNGLKDRDPGHSSFQKLTATNARRLELLALAPGALPGAERAVVDYFDRVLVDPRGGFLTGQGGSQDLEPESNGLALQAWWRLGVRDADSTRRAFAWKSSDRAWAVCRDEDFGLVRKDLWGKIREPSLLADQVEMGRALLFAWRAAGRDTDLVRARELGLAICAHFEDDHGGFRNDFAGERFGKGRRSPRPFEDNARAARFLAELGRTTGERPLANAGRRAWVVFQRQFDKPRLELADWALAVRASFADDGPERSRWGVPEPRPEAPKPAKTPAKKKAAKRR
ncbi:MAG: hypothetical protein U0704_07140 [Candidatus Eisenbacteria bacterium]